MHKRVPHKNTISRSRATEKSTLCSRAIASGTNCSIPFPHKHVPHKKATKNNPQRNVCTSLADSYISPRKPAANEIGSRFLMRCVKASDAPHNSPSQPETPWSRYKCEIPSPQKKCVSHKIMISRSRATEKCKSSSRTSTSRDGHIPYE